MIALSKSEIFQILEDHLNMQLELCDKLENLADALPNEVDTQVCLVLARNILPILHQAHQFEETTLFPELLEQHKQNEHLVATLERLKYEHWEDESYAEELRECLINFATSKDADCVTTLSYMLRGFFEGVRRHIAFERELVAPLLTAGPRAFK